MNRRLIHFAGNTVAIEYSGDRPSRIVDVVFEDIPRVDQGSPQATLRLVPGESFNELMLFVDDNLLLHSQNEGICAVYLLDQTGRYLMERSQGGLLIHAAGLSHQGRGLLFPGPTGMGKSVLTAWLITQGMGYMTDELVFIPDNTYRFQAFPRPINLKWSARSIWQGLVDPVQADQILSSPRIDLLPARLLGSLHPSYENTLDMIIFPNYQPDVDFELIKLSKAQAGLALMKCLINARNLPEHGFHQISEVTRKVPAYRLSYDSFEQIGQSIERLLDLKPN